MNTATSAGARRATLTGLKAAGTVNTHMVDGAQAAAALHFEAARAQSSAAMELASGLLGAEPADLPRVAFERAAAFGQESFQRAVRLGQDLLVLGQKTGAAIQGSLKTA